MKYLGTKMREMREAAGHTQKDVSELLGYDTPQFISNIERGIAHPPDHALFELAEFYRVPYERLVDLVYGAKIARIKERKRHLLEDAS